MTVAIRALDSGLRGPVSRRWMGSAVVAAAIVSAAAIPLWRDKKRKKKNKIKVKKEKE